MEKKKQRRSRKRKSQRSLRDQRSHESGKGVGVRGGPMTPGEGDIRLRLTRGGGKKSSVARKAAGERRR